MEKKIKEILNRPIFNEIVWKFYNEREDIEDKILESIGSVESQLDNTQCYVDRENISVKAKRSKIEEWETTKERKQYKEKYASGLLHQIEERMNVLEYSSADGVISKMISPYANQVFCYEINDDALENTTKETAHCDNITVYDSRAKKGNFVSHEKVTHELGESIHLDIRSQPTFYQLESNSVDLIIVYDEFKYCNKYELWGLFVEMRRVLKPGGRINGFLNIVHNNIEDREQFMQTAKILKRDKYYFNCMKYIDSETLRKVCEYSDLYLENCHGDWGHFSILKPLDVIRDMRKSDYNIGSFLEFLASQINCLESSIVEVGSYAGHSSALMCEKFGEVHCVDPWLGEYDARDLASYSDMQKVENEFDNRMAKFENFRKLKMLSSEAVKLFENNSINVVYLDGDHRYESVRRDILEWYPKVKDGGFIAGHDYGSDFEGTTKAVKEIFGEPQETFPDHSWLVRVSKTKKEK